jgi:hypothetical protein
MRDQKARKRPAGIPIPDQGLGVLCPEAQADGIPCPELGRDCNICPMAAPNRDIPDATDAPPPPGGADESMADW